MNDDFTFDGFTIPEKNYFPMPNEWLDICAKIDSLSELKIIQYVLCHTWGYREYGVTKTISVDEFMNGRRRTDRSRMDNGTGLSEPSVKDGIKRAIKHGYLVCEVNDKDQGRVKKSYGLKMIEEQGKILTPQDTYPVEILPSEDKQLTPRDKDTYPRSEKDTNRKTPEEKQIDSCDGANAPITGDIKIHIAALSQDEDDPKKRRAFMTYARRRVAAANKKTRPKPAPSKPVENKPAKPEPTPEEQAFQARCSALQAQINEWRGWTLTHKGQIINERKAIRSLAEQYTDEQIAEVREYLFNKHWRWSKPDNRYTIGAQIILDEIGNVQQILKHPQKSASNGHSPPGSNGAKPRPSALVSEEQAAKNKARLHERAEAVRAELIRQGKPVPGER